MLKQLRGQLAALKVAANLLTAPGVRHFAKSRRQPGFRRLPEAPILPIRPTVPGPKTSYNTSKQATALMTPTGKEQPPVQAAVQSPEAKPATVSTVSRPTVPRPKATNQPAPKEPPPKVSKVPAIAQPELPSPPNLPNLPKTPQQQEAKEPAKSSPAAAQPTKAMPKQSSVGAHKVCQLPKWAMQPALYELELEAPSSPRPARQRLVLPPQPPPVPEPKPPVKVERVAAVAPIALWQRQLQAIELQELRREQASRQAITLAANGQQRAQQPSPALANSTSTRRRQQDLFRRRRKALEARLKEGPEPAPLCALVHKRKSDRRPVPAPLPCSLNTNMR